MISVITPRPIAWITSVSDQGDVNLAPYSYFNAFGSNPPVVVFSPTVTRDGGMKDTLRNVQANGEFVHNVATQELAEQVNLSSKALPYGDSEVELTGLTLAPSTRVKPPRLVESPVNLECRVIQIMPIGDGPTAGNLVIGEVLVIHIDERVLGGDGRADPRKLRTIGRLGGNFYCRTSDLFELDRPS